MIIHPSATVLFQGDSITDAGRNRDGILDLGRGYALMAAAWYGAMRAEDQIRFMNRGISGNRTNDLVARWQADCLDLAPDVLSILIGINDTWRAFDSNDPTPPEDFEANYRILLEQARERGNPEFVLLEPFLLPNATHYAGMREDLNLKIEAIRRLAREFDAIYVPLDGLFQQACCRALPAHWSPDGVHLTPAGNALVAHAWLEAVGL